MKTKDLLILEDKTWVGKYTVEILCFDCDNHTILHSCGGIQSTTHWLKYNIVSNVINRAEPIPTGDYDDWQNVI